MVHHVIGRKHRQKYVELKRQDLVTWDKESIITQGGKIIRARAEIIERQDGRGSPVALVRRGVEGRLNICKVPPREKQNRSRAQRSNEHNVPPLLPELKGYKEYSSRKFATGYQNTLQFHPDEPNPKRARRMQQSDDPLERDYMEEKLRRKSDMYREEYIDPDSRRVYKKQYAEDPYNFSPSSVSLEPDSVPRYNSREDRAHDQIPDVNYYPDMGPPQRRPFPENDPLKEFYTEEVRRRRGQSAEHQPSHRASLGERQWSLEREPGRHSMIRAGRQGSSEPEVKRGSFRDYLPKETVSYSGPSTSQLQVDVTRTMSNIPEPFRRFLKGDTNDEGSKRKRTSRFSDATVEEVEMTKEMFGDDYGPPKFGGYSRGADAPFGSNILGTQLDHPTESHMNPRGESYQKGALGTDGVFDMLKNIEIETTEDADFLNEKLCSLLREFKSRKLEKNMRNSQGRAVNNSLQADLHYETAHREDSDIRWPDLCFEDDHRGIGRREHDNRFIDYHHLGNGEPRYSNRSHHEDDSPYPERFEEPMYSSDYQPATQSFGTHSAATPLHMEVKPRLDRESRFSNKMDKITSTLLEFVARK
ncbi:uncharacterized protein si:ch211-13c6.2 isoform X2 [Betta splendens]|nr:uncharacterized protein si:ch211-13c6.2 isoform X2 [Betta splendens]XP_029022334.1 uncharacterized protein si:ch211-13c6.2 isoform X2 [Betta splendens]